MDNKETPKILLEENTEAPVIQKAPPLANISLEEEVSGLIEPQLITTPTQTTAAKTPEILPMLSSPASSLFFSMGTRTRKPILDPITGEASLTKGDLTIRMQGPYPLEIKPSVQKLQAIINLLLTAQTDYRGTGELNCKIVLPIKEYMRHVGIKDTKPSSDKALRTLKEDSSLLMNLLMEYESEKGKPEHRYMKARVLTAVEYTPGHIILTVSEQFASHLRSAFMSKFPPALLGTDGKNPILFSLGMKLVNHQAMTSNIETGKADIIGVKSLIEACDNLPKYEEVQASNRSFKQRIIDPLEKSLDALIDLRILQSWEYCAAKKAPLSQEQLEAYDYETVIKWYVKFKIIGFAGIPEATKPSIKKARKSPKGNKPQLKARGK